MWVKHGRLEFNMFSPLCAQKSTVRYTYASFGVKLRSANRSLSHKQKGSRLRLKARLDLARIHRRVSHQRTHFHWRLASGLVKEFDDLAFEDLNLKAIDRIRGRKVGDLGFLEFLGKQEWLAEKYGRRMDKARRFETTTRRMSCCGHIQDVALGERMVPCRRCGATHDRDVNAAKSILEARRRLRSGAECKTSPEAVCPITAESPRL